MRAVAASAAFGGAVVEVGAAGDVEPGGCATGLALLPEDGAVETGLLDDEEELEAAGADEGGEEWLLEDDALDELPLWLLDDELLPELLDEPLDPPLWLLDDDPPEE